MATSQSRWVSFGNHTKPLTSSPQIEMMMTKAGNGHLLTILAYPEAGHLIEPPYSPHFRSSNFILQHTRKKGTAARSLSGPPAISPMGLGFI